MCVVVIDAAVVCVLPRLLLCFVFLRSVLWVLPLLLYVSLRGICCVRCCGWFGAACVAACMCVVCEKLNDAMQQCLWFGHASVPTVVAMHVNGRPTSAKMPEKCS